MFTTIAPLILASGSPRRRDFLRMLGIRFSVEGARVEERALPGEAARDFARRMAADKARAVAGRHPASWVLAADTVVALEGRILGKPVDADQALDMLGRLSGGSHEVITAWHLRRQGTGEGTGQGRAPQDGESFSGEAISRVRFCTAPPELLAAYVATGEPMDKAGAYGIQGLGGVLVERVEGSCSNVVGLPLAEVVQALLRAGVIRARGAAS